MKLDLSTLEEGITEFGFLVSPGSVLNEPSVLQIDKPIRNIVQVVRSGANIRITGESKAIIHIGCSRCLEPIEQVVIASYTTEYQPASLKPGTDIHGTIELRPDDLDVIWYEGNEIDLAEEVRQNIIINLPMQPLCKETCRGLCSQCGKNLNTQTCQCKTDDDSNPFGRLAGLRLT